MKTQPAALQTLAHMVKQVEAHGSHPTRLCCHESVALEIACELEALYELGVDVTIEKTANVLRRRRARGERPLQHGDRVYGLTVDLVFAGAPEGLAWVA